MNLAEALPVQQKRVRELIEIYQEIGPGCAFAIAIMQRSLSNADYAAASGDVVAMLRAFQDLQGFKE